MDLKNWKIFAIMLLSLLVLLDLIGAVVFAVVIAFLTMPLFNFINKIIKQRGVSAFIVSIATLLVVIFPVALIIQSLIANAPSIIIFISGIAGKMAALTKGIGSEAIKTATGTFMGSIISALGKAVATVTKKIIDLFITFVLVYYFLKDAPEIRSYIYGLTKNKKEKTIIQQLENLMKGVIVGSILAGIIIGLISYGIFMVIGIKFAAILALIVGFAAIIPVVGTWVVYIPLVVFEILIKDYRIAAVVGLAGIFVQFLEMYLAPRLSSEMTKIHPAILLLGFIGGPLVFGLKGIVLGPLILGAAKIILDSYKK